MNTFIDPIIRQLYIYPRLSVSWASTYIDIECLYPILDRAIGSQKSTDWRLS